MPAGNRSGEVARRTRSQQNGFVVRWRVAGVVVWAAFGGIFYGWGTEYGPVFSDPPEERSLGAAVAKAVVFGLVLLVFGVARLIFRERRVRGSS